MLIVIIGTKIRLTIDYDDQRCAVECDDGFEVDQGGHVFVFQESQCDTLLQALDLWIGF